MPHRGCGQMKKFGVLSQNFNCSVSADVTNVFIWQHMNAYGIPCAVIWSFTQGSWAVLGSIPFLDGGSGWAAWPRDIMSQLLVVQIEFRSVLKNSTRHQQVLSLYDATSRDSCRHRNSLRQQVYISRGERVQETRVCEVSNLVQSCFTQ